WNDLGGNPWRLSELLSETTYERDGAELTESGLFVALDGWQWHLVSLHQEVAAAPQPELGQARTGRDPDARPDGCRRVLQPAARHRLRHLQASILIRDQLPDLHSRGQHSWSLHIPLPPIRTTG